VPLEFQENEEDVAHRVMLEMLEMLEQME